MAARPPSPRRPLVIMALGTLLASSTALAGPAAAAPPVTGDFGDDFSVLLEDFCGVAGLDLRNEGTFSGRFLVKNQGTTRTAYVLQHTQLQATLTNVATGASVTRRDRTVEKDLRVTDNGDGTVTVLVLVTGVSTVYGTDGKAIARNPGQVRFEVLIDDNDTPSNPDDDEFIADLGVVKGSTGRSDDYCAAIVGEIG